LIVKSKSSNGRAFSPVIAVIILSAVVLAVGGAVWAFSQGAMTIIAVDYAEAVINMTDTISERFIIEQVSYNGMLYVWVYNYGDVDIEIKVQFKNITYPDNWIDLASKEMVLVDPIDFTPDPGENELNIKAYSRRDNNVFYRYILP